MAGQQGEGADFGGVEAIGITRYRCGGMSVSIYYSAARSVPLSASEKEAVQAVEEKYLRDGEPSLGSYEHLDPGVIYQGSVTLPSDDSAADALYHWCDALSELRRVLSHSTWEVTLDDLELVWNEASQAFELPESDPVDDSAIPDVYEQKLAELEQASAGMIGGRVISKAEASELKQGLLSEVHTMVERIVATGGPESIELLARTPAWARSLLDPDLVKQLADLAISHDTRAKRLLW